MCSVPIETFERFRSVRDGRGLLCYGSVVHRVGYGSLADVGQPIGDVRFAPDSGHSLVQVGCPQSAITGHSAAARAAQSNRCFVVKPLTLSHSAGVIFFDGDAESPNVALWIPGTIGAVTVELHLRFHKDFCPGSACALAVSVQIFALSQLDMN